MKIVRFKAGDDIAYGLAEAAGVTVYNGSPFVAWEATETIVPWESVQLLSPVLPSKVVGVGVNFVDHVEEANALSDLETRDQPVIFLKPATSVVGSDVGVVYPTSSADVRPNPGLAIVIGKVSKRVRAEDAASHIFGYTASFDMTAVDLAAIDGQWSRAKGFDSFCPLGPAIETEFDPLERNAIVFRVDSEVRQSVYTSDMVFGVAEILEMISSVMTLLPGDVILTGSPPGAMPVLPGDVIEVDIEGVGVLTNRMVSR